MQQLTPTESLNTYWWTVADADPVHEYPIRYHDAGGRYRARLTPHTAEVRWRRRPGEPWHWIVIVTGLRTLRNGSTGKTASRGFTDGNTDIDMPLWVADLVAQTRPADADLTTPVETRTVDIPACREHDGQALATVTLPWVCPRCGGPRGDVYRTISYDGSRRLGCDGWSNPCGHVDTYVAVRAEAAARTEAVR